MWMPIANSADGTGDKKLLRNLSSSSFFFAEYQLR
jgi:hypothetical protein